MAVGNAVVLCDFFGVGPMITSANLDRLRSVNFGIDGCTGPLRSDYIRAELERYNASDATEVSRRVREQAGLIEATRSWLALYRSVVDEFRSSHSDVAEELRALGVYIVRRDRENRTKEVQLRDELGVPSIARYLRYLARRFLRT